MKGAVVVFFKTAKDAEAAKKAVNRAASAVQPPNCAAVFAGVPAPGGRYPIMVLANAGEDDFDTVGELQAFLAGYSGCAIDAAHIQSMGWDKFTYPDSEEKTGAVH